MTGPYFNGMCAAELAGMYPAKFAEVLLDTIVESGGGGGVNGIAVETAPANFTDFSMFPNGQAPATGTYIALTPTKQWLFTAGDTQWRYTDRISS